jgi:ferredoxin
MPKLTIQDGSTTSVPQGKRLINALIDDAKADQHYSCGGNAKCTTCRVQFVSGEPSQITQAEKDLLKASGLDQQPGLRLSCQIVCDHDMTVKVISPKPPNKTPARPTDEIAPPAVWTTR